MVFIDVRKPGRGTHVHCDSSEEGNRKHSSNLATELFLFYRASQCIGFQGTCVEKQWACVTEPCQPETFIFMIDICYHKRTRCSSQDTHLSVRKKHPAINKHFREEPDSLKPGFYIHLFQSGSCPHGSSPWNVTQTGLCRCCVSSLVLYLAQIGLLLQTTGFIHYMLILSHFTSRR